MARPLGEAVSRQERHADSAGSCRADPGCESGFLSWVLVCDLPVLQSLSKDDFGSETGRVQTLGLRLLLAFRFCLKPLVFSSSSGSHVMATALCLVMVKLRVRGFVGLATLQNNLTCCDGLHRLLFMQATGTDHKRSR